MQAPFMLGWEEWLALPELGLPAVKAKVDTGARTSALHASLIEEIGSAEHPQVRFVVHPIPGRDDITISCVADIADVREIVSSNGETERRYIIRTNASIGGRQWPIEIGLTNRASMTYRMLLGRQAIPEDAVVDPQASFLQPRLSYRVYGMTLASEASTRPLSIAILSRRPENAGNRRLVRQGELRGHTVTIVDRRRVSLYIAANEPAILVNGAPLTPPDALIFRAGRSPSAFSLAIVRQMEVMGTFALNPSTSLAMVGDALVQRQVLAAAGLPVPEVAVSPTEAGRKALAVEHKLADSVAALRAGPIHRFAVIGGRALAAIERGPATSLDTEPDWQPSSLSREAAAPARDAAESAARALGLGLVAVDVALSRVGPQIIGMTANVSISTFDRLAGTAMAEAIVVHIERVVAARHAPRA